MRLEQWRLLQRVRRGGGGVCSVLRLARQVCRVEVLLPEFVTGQIGQVIGSKDGLTGATTRSVPFVLALGAVMIFRPNVKALVLFRGRVISFVVTVHPGLKFQAQFFVFGMVLVCSG